MNRDTQDKNNNLSVTYHPPNKFPFSQFFKKFLKENYPKNTCCCCGHSLENHVDEGRQWRCHCLGPDFYQCECRLRKHEDGLVEYDLNSRIANMKKEEEI